MPATGPLSETTECTWLDQASSLLQVGVVDPRDPDVHPYYHSVIDYSAMRDELESVELCWKSIKNKDIKGIGDSFNACYDAQTRLFPLIENENVRSVMNWLREQCYGCKMTGAGAGGYCIIASDEPIGRSIKFTPVGLK